MSKKILLFWSLSLLWGVGQCFGEEVSAFYTLPVGAFVGEVTEQGTVSHPYNAVYLPYSSVGHTWTSIDPQAESPQWKIINKIIATGNSYTRTNDGMNSGYCTPLLIEDSKVSYQYGGWKETEINPNAHTYIGDSVSHFMTPAKLVCDFVQAGGSNPTLLITSKSYYSKTHDTIGLYFNNTDMMYIDSIRIPIYAGTNGTGVGSMFPEDNSHVKVTIYSAITIGGKNGNTADRTKVLAELTLGKDNFTAHNETPKTGTIQAPLSLPISITGPFVVELTEIKKSGCDFYVYVANERDGCNYWGYYVEGDGSEIYHNFCTPAICVKAMFPALYGEQDENVNIVLGGGEATEDFQRTIYANKRYSTTTNDFSDNADDIDWCSIKAIKTTKTSVTFAFSAEANRTGDVREADWTLSYRGKTITYHLSQPSSTNWTEVRNGLQSGNFGTLCLPQNISTFTGATLWEIAYRTNSDIILEESQTLTAGTPYIYQATSDKIEVIYGEGTVTHAGSKNGLHGTLTGIDISTGNYILYNNEFVKCGTGCSIDGNRAYLVLDEVPTTPTPATAGIRRIAMGYPSGATALDNISEGGYGKPTKFIHNGRMYIQVNEQLFQFDGQKIR